ncbi:SUR7/PalI family-domain-containing protein [Vararia minispora EC-137]|uniref:SUR7/PalI family-domain-containing protein n=1 Tax=Vararia minispora EC-137 TaxID=1314806 RepID=A0ACB8QTV0_9AGAM|nr:SUR7/PalI family-domain-containing protein [Vararia minispora EC-137]
MYGGQPYVYGAGYGQAPRRRYRKSSSATSFFLFAAFLLLLLVALSLPIIKAIYLLELEATNAQGISTNLGTSVRFGVWGYCINSSLVPPGVFTNNGSCEGPELGYTLNSELFRIILGINNSNVELILRGLTILLILHPVAAGLALLTALPVYLSCCIFHNTPWIIALIFSVVTAILTTIVFAADLALVLVSRNRLSQISEVSLAINFGPGVWMVLAGMVCTWIALVLLSAKVCRCCGYRYVSCSN